jgi:hypothetical protein
MSEPAGGHFRTSRAHYLLKEEAVEPHRQHADPYREPSPPEDEDRVVLTCEEMRRSTDTANAVLLVLAAGAIAWLVVGR